MTRGDFSDIGQPVGGGRESEALALALDVMGAHIEQAQRGMRAYIAAMTTAQEAERARIARELHDDTVQRLIALSYGVERAQRALTRDADTAAERLSAVRTEIAALVKAVRDVIADLRPPALDELGLLPAIRLLLERGGEDTPEATLTVDGHARRPDGQSELALFRILQEAWSNILRHAHARHAQIELHYERNALDVVIADDGQGFDPSTAVAPASGWGLLGMRERAALVGGSVTVDSAAGRGTRVTIRIPYLGLEGRDPVCGMDVGPDALTVEYDNQLFRFCSEACRRLFEAQPERYAHAGVSIESFRVAY